MGGSAKVGKCEGVKVRRCESVKVRRCESGEVGIERGRLMGYPMYEHLPGIPEFTGGLAYCVQWCMKTVVVVAWLALAGSVTAGVQTNEVRSQPFQAGWLAATLREELPAAQEQPLRFSLREEVQPVPESGRLRLTPTNGPSGEPYSASASRDRGLDAGFSNPVEQHVYRMLDEGGYLTPAKRPDSPIQRGIDAIWEPEVFQVGRVKMSCAVATAVKRKNPLCLLTPLFFQMNW